MKILPVEPGTVVPCPVAPDALQGIKRQQTNPARWNGAGWTDFVADLRAAGVELAQGATACGVYATDAGGSAYGLPQGVLLDMTGMSRVRRIDAAALTVRTEAGIYWHALAEELRRENLDYLSAPLNLTSSVGGTLGVGGIDVNSARLGCSADQALSLQVVTPTGEIVECSDGTDFRCQQSHGLNPVLKTGATILGARD